MLPLLQRRDNIATTIELKSDVGYLQEVLSYKAEIVNDSLIKRLFDFTVSAILFTCVFSWLFPIIAILIKLSSRGPVLFKQERTGLNDKKIICYKFRTMMVESPVVDINGKYIQATQNDPRVTLIGKFLRKTSLDELPQFWNVLKGDMSIIGPRPHPVALNIECNGTIDNYELRHLIKPGITGWAQVKGYRGGTKEQHLMQTRIDHDIWYIENWSLLLDIKVFFMTITNVILGDENAY